MSSDPADFVDRSVQSDCCQAPVLSGGFCSECREHCEEEPIEPSERDLERQMEDFQRPLTAIENWQRNDEHNVK